jgi:hypothetical protein
MEWNAQAENRLTELRLKELYGTLTSAEQAELETTLRALDLEESQVLAESARRIEENISLLQARVQALQSKNEELARLLEQYES